MKVIVIGGPTATGKTEIALKLALSLKAEIINFDSLQIYEGLDIGTAKPTPSELGSVPHHLISIVKPHENFSAGDFRRKALSILAKKKDSKFALLVGGTGFYLKALLEGMFDLPVSNPELKNELVLQNPDDLFQKLKELDPETANALHPNDTYRVIRALEVVIMTGQTMSQAKEDFKSEVFPYPFGIFAPEVSPEELRDRIQSRTSRMIQNGLLDEVRGFQKIYGDLIYKIKPFQSVGYKEALQHLRGDITLGEMADLISIHTSQLAKRQRTWFRNQVPTKWMESGELISRVLAENSLLS